MWTDEMFLPILTMAYLLIFVLVGIDNKGTASKH